MHVQLFEQFAPAGVFGRFAPCHLAAGELPKPFHAAVAALHGKDFVGVRLADDTGGDVDGFHKTLLIRWDRCLGNDLRCRSRGRRGPTLRPAARPFLPYDIARRM